MNRNLTSLPSAGPSGEVALSVAYLAPENPEGIVVFVHGMAEHKERYFPVMTYLAEMGYAAVAYDQRGHGATAASAEERGYFGKRGPEALVEDLLHVVLWAKGQWPEAKLFLFGHSLGTLVIRNLMKQHDDLMDGVVLGGSPSIDPLNSYGIFLTRVVQLFKGSRYRSRKVAMAIFKGHEKKYGSEGMHNAWLCSNRAVVQAFNNDPLCGFKFTVSGYRALLQLFARTYSEKGWKVSKPELPVHFASGGNDAAMRSLKEFSKSVECLRRVGYRHITTKVYPGMRHEILNELRKEEVWADLASMLRSWL